MEILRHNNVPIELPLSDRDKYELANKLAFEREEVYKKLGQLGLEPEFPYVPKHIGPGEEVIHEITQYVINDDHRGMILGH